MLLTPGSLLQQDRYWIEAILQEDDMAVSYRALHRNLDKHVVIQTLGRTLHQHPKADLLRHDFLTQVRQHHQAQGSAFHVIDCFVEGNAPFVVLDLEENQALPVMSQWLPNLSAVLQDKPPAIADASTDLKTAVASTGATEQDNSSTNSPTYPPTPASPTDRVSPSPYEATATHGKGMSTNGTGSYAPAPSTAAKTQVFVQSAKKHAPVRSKRSPWMPVSLLLTAIIGGCGGAYLGWQIRQGHSFADVVPVVGPKINTEQDFPPLDDWPNQADVEEVREAEDLGSSPRSTAPGESRVRGRTATDSGSDEAVPVEPYGINYRPGEPTLPYDDEVVFPTQETRAVPDMPGSASAPAWEDEDYAPGATGDAPVEPVPVPDGGSLVAPVEAEQKDKLETLPGLPQTPQAEERSLPPRSQTSPQIPAVPAFPEGTVTPQ